MSKQDRVAPRTAADIERKYNFGQTFAEFAGLVDTAQKAADDAKSAVNDLDKALDQDEIFNRLTNNGEVQGIYRADDGQVYINASYLVTGILRSKNGDTFYLDLDNGVLKGKFEELSISGKTVDTIAQEKANTAEGNAKSYADTAASNAVSAQTQTDIFNKLTNNGALQGLYMKDGKLYINATYIKSGKIVSEGMAYLPPTYDDCIDMLRSLTFPDKYPPKNFYDINGDGKFDVEDVRLANRVYLGEVRMSDCAGATATAVTVTIDPFNAEETIVLVGTNIWGKQIDMSLGVVRSMIPHIYGDCSVSGRLSAGDHFVAGRFATSIGETPKTLSWKDNGDGTFTLIGK